jgi:hypothetical protein
MWIGARGRDAARLTFTEDSRKNPATSGAFRGGQYWARTSDPSLLSLPKPSPHGNFGGQLARLDAADMRRN